MCLYLEEAFRPVKWTQHHEKNPDEDSQISKKKEIEEIKSPVVSHLTENQQTEDLLSKVLPTVLEKITNY